MKYIVKNISRNVFIPIGIAVFSLVLYGFVSVNNAFANTCTAQASSSWSAAGTWTGCGSVIPTSSDAVVIPDGFTVTVDTAAVANTVTISNVGNAAGITISGSNSLTVTGTVTLALPQDISIDTLAVGSGTLTVGGDLVVTSGNSSSEVSQVTVSTGTINVTGNISLQGSVSSAARFNSSGASTTNVGGTLTSGGTVIFATSSTLAFIGTGAQTINQYLYGGITINKPSGTATFPSSATTVNGSLTVTSGTLDVADNVLTVSGATTLGSAGTVLFSSATGLKTFTGNVTVNNGGTWNETAPVNITFGGNLTNNGVQGSASTGVHTFAGNGKTIGGSAASFFPSVSITGNTTNSGTLTASTLITVAVSTTLTNNGILTTPALNGSGIFTAGVNSNLNLSDGWAIAVFNGTASGNTVNYTKLGDQTILPVPQYNITLSGSGVKTMSNLATVAGTLTIVMGGHNYTATSGNTSNTLTINPSTIVAVIPSGTFTLKSPDSFILSAFDGTVTATAICNPTNFFNSISFTGTGSTFTITPTTTATCFVNGGGGGQLNMTSSTTPAPVINGSSSTVNANSTTSIPSITPTLTPLPVTALTPVVVVSPPTITYNFGTSTLRKGSRGAAVMELQKFLNATLSLGLVVDGKLGSKTIAVVKQWQMDHNLVADGLVGAKTKVTMNASVQ